MAEDLKNACKYYTYVAKSESNCFNVSWTIMDVSKLEIDKEYEILHDQPSLCYLALILKISSNYVFLYVRNRFSSVTSDITTNVFNEDGNELVSSSIIGESINTEKCCVISVDKSKLFKGPNCLPSDTLTIDLEFRIKQVKTWGSFEEKYLNYETGKNLSNDLNKFILENFPTGVVLKTKDAQIEANKVILCARSSVFKKMFDNPMSEQEKDIVLIDDMTGSTVKILVNFMNTDKADLKQIEYSALNELYYAADKYDVQDLRNMCAAYILHGLTIENVCGVLELSKKHSDEHLKKGCMLFFRRNIVTFMESDGWKNLKTSDPELCNEIFEFYVKGVTNSK